MFANAGRALRFVGIPDRRGFRIEPSAAPPRPRQTVFITRGALPLTPWDVIGLAGIIVVLGTLLVFGRSLRAAPARAARWADPWRLDERPVTRLPRIPLRREAPRREPPRRKAP
jgi:hypothetical protein